MCHSRLAIAVLCCLAGLASIAVVAGAPPPTQLCGSCGADEIGATEPGTVDITIDADGTSRWVERVPVNESAADRYRDDPDALEGAVADVWNRGSQHIGGHDVDRAVALEDDTVVVTYTIPDVARPGVRDARLVDYFALDAGNDRYRLAAERVTIQTPEETVITTAPRHATVEGNTATWGATESSESGDSSPPRFDRRTLLTYSPSETHGLAGTASGYATIGLEIGPDALAQGTLAGLGPGLLLAVAGIAAGRADWGRSAFDAAALERLLVFVGVIGAIGLTSVSVATTGRPFSTDLGALSALGIGYATLAVTARRSVSRNSTRRLTVLAILVAFGTGLLLWLFGGPSAVVVLPIGLATALFLPIGFAFEHRSSPLVSILLVVLAVLALLIAAVGFSLLAAPAGLGMFIYWFVLVGWTVVIAVFGSPLALLGRRLARHE